MPTADTAPSHEDLARAIDDVMLVLDVWGGDERTRARIYDMPWFAQAARWRLEVLHARSITKDRDTIAASCRGSSPSQTNRPGKKEGR